MLFQLLLWYGRETEVIWQAQNVEVICSDVIKSHVPRPRQSKVGPPCLKLPVFLKYPKLLLPSQQWEGIVVGRRVDWIQEVGRVNGNGIH